MSMSMGGDKPRPRRISVSVREGPSVESRSGKVLREAFHEVFNCCSSESTCHHRKSLADHTLTSDSWTSLAIADSMQFAREGMVDVPERDSFTDEGNTYSFGNHSTIGEDDDNLDDFQRAVRCLRSAFKTFAASNFDRFIKEDESRALTEVWPLLQSELKRTAKAAAEVPTDTESFPGNFHEPAARKLPVAIVELYKTGNDAGAKKLLGLIFDLIPSLNKEVSMYWVESLERLVEACNSANVQRDIYPNIAELAGGGKGVSTNGKVGVCRLLRKLAKRFNSEVIERKVFPMMGNLVRDDNAHVRIAAASSLPEMIHRIKNKNEALELINAIKEDPEPSVRAALTSTIVKSVTLMNPRDEKNKEYLDSVMHTLKLLVKDAYGRGNIDLLVAYSEYMGHICESFTAANIMKGRDVLWYLDTFLQLSKYDAKLKTEETQAEDGDEMPTGFANFRANMEFTRRHSIVEALISTKTPAIAERAASQAATNTNRAIAVLRENAGSRRMSVPYGGGIAPSVCIRHFGPELERAYECRMNAAKQFYDFMMFAKPIVGFRHGLHPLVSDLMHDPNSEVRAAMAEKILPIMEHLGPEAGVLHGELVYGLSDDDLDVIQAIVPNLSRILKCLVLAKVLSPERITPKLVEIGGAILYCEERLNQSTFYKVHQFMLDQFTILPFCLPGDYVYNNFVPALLHRLRHMRILPCRMAAANAIVIFLRHCRRSAQREDIRKRMRTGFAQGRSVHDRMLFLYMAKKIMEKFSRKYFRDHFFDDVLLLANDPVVNVRRKVVELMPELNEAIEDPSMLKLFEDTFRSARKSEVDRDVKAKIEEISAKLNLSSGKSNPQLSDKGKKGGKAGDSQKKKKDPKQDPEDLMKEMEEDYIESMEGKGAGNGKDNTNFEDKRKGFYGSTKRHSIDAGHSSSTKLAFQSASPQAQPTTVATANETWKTQKPKK